MSCTSSTASRRREPSRFAASSLELCPTVHGVDALGSPFRDAQHIAQPQLRQAQREIQRLRARPPLDTPPSLGAFALVAVCAPCSATSSSSPRRRSSACSPAAAPAAFARSSSPIQRRSLLLPSSATAHKALGACPQRLPLLARQARGQARVAERQARARQRALGLGLLQARRDPRRRERIEAHVLAARGDRREHVLAPVGDQQQMDERRRLLERLQHPVRRLVVHRVGPLDHEHAPRGFEWRARRARPPPAPRCRPRAFPRRRSASPRSGRGASRARPARPPRPRSRAPSASSAAANARATVRLPVPDGPWNR